MLAEAVIPGAQFVVVGVALFLSGLVGVLVGGVFASLVALSFMTVAFGVFAYFAFREMDLYNGPDRGKTSDSDDLSGVTGVVTERVTARGGTVRLDEGGGFDPNFQAESRHGDIEEGEEVIVTDPGGGNVLTVERLNVVEQDSIDRELARGRTESSDEPVESSNAPADVGKTTERGSERSESVDSEETETESA
jgi:Membrane protein implicated in regulation of membrane protease activity